MADKSGDQTFRATANNEWWPEMTYGGALSFGRRRYSRDLDGVMWSSAAFPMTMP